MPKCFVVVYYLLYRTMNYYFTFLIIPLVTLLKEDMEGRLEGEGVGMT